MAHRRLPLIVEKQILTSKVRRNDNLIVRLVNIEKQEESRKKLSSKFDFQIVDSFGNSTLKLERKEEQ